MIAKWINEYLLAGRINQHRIKGRGALYKHTLPHLWQGVLIVQKTTRRDLTLSNPSALRFVIRVPPARFELAF